MHTIAKRFQFSASHILQGLPDSHPCSRLHGHNYEIELILGADRLDERGFVVDYDELRAFGSELSTRFDHRHLNDVLAIQPSAENIAEYLYGLARERWPQTVAVRVSETPATWAEFRP